MDKHPDSPKDRSRFMGYEEKSPSPQLRLELPLVDNDQYIDPAVLMRRSPEQHSGPSHSNPQHTHASQGEDDGGWLDPAELMGSSPMQHTGPTQCDPQPDHVFQAVHRSSPLPRPNQATGFGPHHQPNMVSPSTVSPAHRTAAPFPASQAAKIIYPHAAASRQGHTKTQSLRDKSSPPKSPPGKKSSKSVTSRKGDAHPSKSQPDKATSHSSSSGTSRNPPAPSWRKSFSSLGTPLTYEVEARGGAGRILPAIAPRSGPSMSVSGQSELRDVAQGEQLEFHLPTMSTKPEHTPTNRPTPSTSSKKQQHFICKICGSFVMDSFLTEEDLEDHMRAKHPRQASGGTFQHFSSQAQISTLAGEQILFPEAGQPVARSAVRDTYSHHAMEPQMSSSLASLGSLAQSDLHPQSMDTSASSRWMSCGKCNEPCRGALGLQAHIGRKHTELSIAERKELIKCAEPYTNPMILCGLPGCQKRVRTEDGLEKHLRSLHKTEFHLFVCECKPPKFPEVCKYGTSSASEIRLHLIQSHGSNGPYRKNPLPMIRTQNPDIF